jgi:small subunit ribosomal protein S30e
MPTHGSLTKAGKVRSQTPKIEPRPRRRPFPRRKMRRNYKVRILYPMIYGQEGRTT